MWTVAFWKAVGERALKSGAQFVLWSILGVGVVGSAIVGTVDGEASQVINAFALDYRTLLGAFLGGVLFSVLTSLVSLPLNGGNGPSLTSAEQVIPRDSIVVHEDSLAIPPLGEGDRL